VDGKQTADSQQHTNPPAESRGLAGWVEDNIAKPFVSGTGVLQIANNFREKPLEWQAPESKNKAEWAVQTLSSAVGALAMYIPAGKATGGVLKALGRSADSGLIALGSAEGLSTHAAKFFASESAGSILGAGLYDAAKAPNAGDTRLGNSLASMAGFSVFEAGNRSMHLFGRSSGLSAIRQAVEGTLGETGAKITAATTVGLSRYAIGTLGGATSFLTGETLNANLNGRNIHWEGLGESMASGGFVNMALPVAQRAATRAVDTTVNSVEFMNKVGLPESWARGVPVSRFVSDGKFSDPDVSRLVAQNPLARVKTATDAVTRADIAANVVHVADGTKPASLAHELEHLRLSRLLEPHYKYIAEQVSKNPDNPDAYAEPFYKLRQLTEEGARQTEAAVMARQTEAAVTTLQSQAPVMARQSQPAVLGTVDGATGPIPIRDQPAGNGRTYGENWQAEWQSFKENVKFRPRVEYEGAREIPGTIPGDPVVAPPADALGAELVREGNKILGTNFAIHSTADAMDLLLFRSSLDAEPQKVIEMKKEPADGTVFRAFVPDAQAGTLYGYRAHGPYDPHRGLWFNPHSLIMDPYGKAFTGPTFRPRAFDSSNPFDEGRHFKMRTESNFLAMPRAVVVDDAAFDWQGVKRPNIAKSDIVMYEVHVRSFTARDPEVSPSHRGTYLGVADKIPYLLARKVNAIKLMPTNASDFWEDGRKNDWRYQPWNHMAPTADYSTGVDHQAPVNEFKTMARELHRNGIMLVSDEVVNHSAEGGVDGPTISYRGLDNHGYYWLDPNNPFKYIDHTGCGNTLNPFSSVVQRLVLDSLRRKVMFMGIDGHREDLGTAIWKRDPNETLLKAIKTDPILKDRIHAFEPWDMSAQEEGNFGVGNYHESGRIRDLIRSAIKSDENVSRELANVIRGRRFLYGENSSTPISAVTTHDGYSLADVLSYNEKHNEANGENNRDGTNDNKSYNWGHEGPVENSNLPDEQKQAIKETRERLANNAFLLQLLPVDGTIPMIQQGDEMGHTKGGNNNTYAVTEPNDIQWEKADQKLIDRRTRYIDLRHEHQLGALGAGDVSFHGTDGNTHSLEPAARFMAAHFRNTGNGTNQLYVAMNNYWEPLEFKLPQGRWRVFEDTQMSTERVLNGDLPNAEGTYKAGPRSYVVLVPAEPQANNHQ
jgi:isoamylase